MFVSLILNKIRYDANHAVTLITSVEVYRVIRKTDS